jgi:glutamate-ammonia-ligase adenylyltransferase
MQQLQRLALGSESEGETLPEGLKNRMCRAAGEDEFEVLEARLEEVKLHVHRLAREKLHLPATES